LFGLDAAAAGLVIVIVGLVLEKSGRVTKPALAGLAAGLATVLTVAAMWALIQGVFGAMFFDTVVYPLTRFSEAMGVSWGHTFSDTGYLGRPFSELMTGEVLPEAWPGHETMRIVGLRTQLITIWMIVPLGLWRWWMDRKSPEAAPLGFAIGLALAGWTTLATRTDVMHLGAAWYGSLILLPALVWRISRRRMYFSVLAGIFALFAFLPQTGEKIWLGTNQNRPSLQYWKRPTAKVQVASDRIKDLEELFVSLPWDGQSPLLIWPVQPGLHVLLDAPLATSQATLLKAEVRDPDLIIAELEKTRPSLCLQGSSAGIFSEIRSIKPLAPKLWTYLRRHYGIYSQTSTPDNQYWVLERISGGEKAIRSLPLGKRLVDNEQRIANKTSVHLQPGRQVGQSFMVGDLDFSGIVVLWFTAAELPVQFPVRISLWGQGANGFSQLLGQWQMDVNMQQESERNVLQVEAVAGTAQRAVAVTYEVLGDVPDGIFLGTHTPLPGQSYEDSFPEGEALVDGLPVAGDLYFQSY